MKSAMLKIIVLILSALCVNSFKRMSWQKTSGNVAANMAEKAVGTMSSIVKIISTPLAKSRFISKLRFRRLYRKPIELIRLRTPFIMNENLENDLKNALLSPECGVKILWGPEGCGKTTYVNYVLSTLKREKKIKGAFTITASHTDDTPRKWLDSMVSDMLSDSLLRNGCTFSTLLKEKSTSVLSYDEPLSPLIPVVIVIDQIENIRRTDDMNILVKSLAEDSVLTKTHVVLIITNNAAYARGLMELNGRTKIHSIGDFERYKWNESQIDTWLQYSKVEGEQRGELRKAGLIAGTPGFLIDNESAVYLPLLESSAKYYKTLWTSGLEMIHQGFRSNNEESNIIQ